MMQLAMMVTRVLLALYPLSFREAFSEEMQHVVVARLDDAKERGRCSVLGVLCQEYTGLL